MERGEGIYFWAGGKRYADFNSQLMCTNIGHGHPHVIKAIQEQAEELSYAGPPMATKVYFFFSNDLFCFVLFCFVSCFVFLFYLILIPNILFLFSQPPPPLPQRSAPKLAPYSPNAPPATSTNSSSLLVVQKQTKMPSNLPKFLLENRKLWRGIGLIMGPLMRLCR